MGNAQALLTWPEEVMKILHCAFSSLAVLFLALAFSDLQHSVSFVLMCMALTASAGIIIWFIIGDPRKFKSQLLMYYIGAVGVCGAASVILIAKFHNECAHWYSGCYSDKFWGKIFGAMLCSLGAWATYCVSAYFNGASGKA